MRISDWSSDVCSSHLEAKHRADDELPVLPELAIVEEVREPAIVIAVIGGDLRLQLAFDDRPRDRGIGDDAQARLDRDAAAHVEFVGGLAGAHEDRAAGHVAAEQYALRTAQHFDRLEIERSEEHTSELQSLMRISYAVFCLKKNT